MASPVDILLLFPYYAALKIRHFLYDRGWRKSESFSVPVVSVGNVAVGGTGKTPHVEAIIRLMQDSRRIAVVSRGYRRKSSGYREVQVSDDAALAGDEPLQIKRKFPGVRVVVDADRRRAIRKLEALPEPERPQLVLLDDAFQHRAVRPALSIVLTDYSRPVFRDHLLPLGRLRDLPEEIRRADLVIVTKCPLNEVSSAERSRWRRDLGLLEYQTLLFSKLAYGRPVPVFPDGDTRYIYSRQAVLFTGIANDFPLLCHVRSEYRTEGHFRFGDHHRFTRSEWREMEKTARKYPMAVWLTTEKDASRISRDEVPESMRSRMFCIPVEAEILPLTEHLPRVIPEEMKELGEQEFRKRLVF